MFKKSLMHMNTQHLNIELHMTTSSEANINKTDLGSAALF